MGKSKDDGLEYYTKALDKMGEIDPMAIIIMTAAGVAGMAGQVGPLTRVLNTFGNGTGVGSMPAGVFSVTGPGILYNLVSLFVPVQNGQTGQSAAEQNENIERIGYAAMNIVEAGLIYTLVKNDEVLKTLMAAAKDAVGGVASLKVVPV